MKILRELTLRKQDDGSFQYIEGYFLTVAQLSKITNIHADYLEEYLNTIVNIEPKKYSRITKYEKILSCAFYRNKGISCINPDIKSGTCVGTKCKYNKEITNGQ